MLAEAVLVCLALNVYHEARDQGPIGEMAVAHVVLNRVESNKFPNSICGVVSQGGYQRRNRCQFSWYCDGKSDKPFDEKSWARAQEVAKAALTDGSEDPTDGALYYHAHYVSPKWAKSFRLTATIGDHNFYAEE